MNATPFLFDTDFRKPRANPAAARAAEEAAQAAAEAHARGLEAGRAEGRAEVQAQVQARLADAMNRLSLSLAGLLAQTDARDAEREALAMEVSVLIARRVAGEALDARPAAAIGEAARHALQHLRGVPHLVVRVQDGLVEETEALMRGLARERGYEGRLVVLGDPDLAPGDARIEWADGGVVRTRDRLEAEIDVAVAACLGHSVDYGPDLGPDPDPTEPVSF